MIKQNAGIEDTNSYTKRASRRPLSKNGNEELYGHQSAPRELLNSPLTAIDEAKRRWPGIAILSNRQLDEQLGIAVYFTFPGGKYMAVWISGTNNLSMSGEDRPLWQRFISALSDTTNGCQKLVAA